MGCLKPWNTILILGLLALLQSQAQSKDLSVFSKGEYQVTKPIKVGELEFSSPEPLLIVSPKEAGLYPVLFFIHGTLISNDDYTDVFNHIASHGYIVVAPMLCSLLHLPSLEDEIEMAASVLNWLPSNLQSILQNQIGKIIQVDFDKLAISGHSRGGKTAFALALGICKTKLNVKISALIGVDPVAGVSKQQRLEPYVLTYEPNSFDLSIPITIIGSGLGNNTVLWVIPPCAPNNVNHQEFYNECKECSHFVIMDYGHMQMLNDLILDPAPCFMSFFCAYSLGPKSIMRRTLGGIMVAFLDAYFVGNEEEYFDLMANPSLAPTKLFVEKKGYYFEFAPNYAYTH